VLLEGAKIPQSHLFEDLPPEELIFGKSALMQAIRKELEQTAPTDLPILVEGESGCGKDVLGRLVHQKSSRSESRFVKVRCPVLQPGRLGVDLFEDDQEAFMTAWMLMSGQAQVADGGTLVLDEISDLEWPFQNMLLRILQDEPSAWPGRKRLDVRLICLTHRNLQKQVEPGAFRKDLFYRINAVHIHVPPLRNRADDIPDLVNYMLRIYPRLFNVPVRPLPDKLMRVLQTYHWPGNIRELEIAVKRYLITGGEAALLSSQCDRKPERPRAIRIRELQKPKDTCTDCTQQVASAIIDSPAPPHNRSSSSSHD
jgi:two-component system response regulator AtoC